MSRSRDTNKYKYKKLGEIARRKEKIIQRDLNKDF